jgi:hypothetical protein
LKLLVKTMLALAAVFANYAVTELAFPPVMIAKKAE